MNLPSPSSLNERTSSNQPQKSAAISLNTLIVIAVSFFVGALLAVLVIKAASPNVESISTSDLIALVFGIVLSAASAVLAMVAISLGKTSEQVLIRRSDESIRLQNELFARTVEALSRIQSSTGVIDRRIEDIISGRVVAISERVTQRVDEDLVRPKYRPALQEEIRQSMLEELEIPRRYVRNERKLTEEKRKDREAFAQFTNSVLAGLANSPRVRFRTLGLGAYGATGDGIFDGIFEVDNKRFAVVTLGTASGFDHAGLKSYLNDIAARMQATPDLSVFLAFDPTVIPDSRLALAVPEFRGGLDRNLNSRLDVIFGTAEEIVQAIDQKI